MTCYRTVTLCVESETRVQTVSITHSQIQFYTSRAHLIFLDILKIPLTEPLGSSVPSLGNTVSTTLVESAALTLPN